MRKIGKDQSLYSDNKTSLKVQIGTRNAGPSPTSICNAFRKAKAIDEKLIFSEWKKRYMKEYWYKRKQRAK